MLCFATPLTAAVLLLEPLGFFVEVLFSAVVLLVDVEFFALPLDFFEDDALDEVDSPDALLPADALFFDAELCAAACWRAASSAAAFSAASCSAC